MSGSAEGEINRRLQARGWRWVVGEQSAPVAPAYKFEAKVYDEADQMVITVQGGSTEEAVDKLLAAVREIVI